MPVIEKKERSELTGALDSFLAKKRRDRAPTGRDEYDPDFLNIIEFIERFKLLPNGLYPVQKFILKLYYNLKLDDTLPKKEVDRIRVTKTFRQKDPVYMTEVEYLRFLYDQGRCNIGVQDGRSRKELILVIGRRSGKSTLSSLIASYELYKLLRRGYPQAYYGMPPGSEIRVLCIANDKEQASIVYQEMSGYMDQVDYFKSSKAHDTQTYLKFRSESDREKFGDAGKATIAATFKSCIAKGLRGRGVMCIILDEFAFFVDESNKSSAEAVYRALTPATKQFTPRDPSDRRIPIGPSDGRIISISSPDAKEGYFYKLYNTALAGGDAGKNMLMIQAPTWEVNTTLSEEDYEVEYAKDPRSFDTEFGAQFSDRVRGWIEVSKDLTDCIIKDLRPKLRGQVREPHFCGLDFALSGDGTALVLTHLVEGRVQMAYHETWQAGRAWRESNPHLEIPPTEYALKIQEQKRLDMEEVINWILAISKRFYIEAGVFDQWAGIIFEQKLHKVGLIQFESRKFTDADSSQAYGMTKTMMFSKMVGLYDYPIPESGYEELGQGRHSPHIRELLELQATSGGKNIIVVSKPNVAGKHDDFSDAWIRSNLLAAEYIRKNPHALEATMTSIVAAPVAERPMTPHQLYRNRIRMHGPPPPERTIPKNFRRR